MANECSFSDLILLIGTNPLPNFVVADYFLQQKHSALERVWLLHAKENERIRQAATIEQAQRVEKLLRDRQRERAPERTISFEKVGIPDVGDPENIRSEVTDKVLEHIRNRDFHLDYSGGTKAMSTQAYWACKAIENHGREKSFSYLDARSFRLIDDTGRVLERNLRERVRINFEQLFELHGFSQSRRVKPRIPQNSDAVEKVEQRLKQGKPLKDLGQHDFEDYIAWKSHEKYQQKQAQVYLNWGVQKPEWTKDFELDVLIVYGYQLIGISCTTSTPEKVCKQRGFEIIHHVRQIGGDEAKAVVMTAMPSISTGKVHQEILHETGVEGYSMLVLGKEELQADRFVDRIGEFIWGRDY